jgi:proteasome lid subunit RPN8/RPN11
MDYLLEDFQDLGNNKPILKSFKFALQDKDRERFGYFKYCNNRSDYEFIECKNSNTHSPHHFNVNNSSFYQDYIGGDVISMFHTHTVESAYPSEIDIELSESLSVPSYIFSISSKESFLYYPKSYKPNNLYGRIFIPFFQDCVSFARDYYSINYNIKLCEDIENWARSKDTSNDRLLEHIEDNFTEIDIKSIKTGDLIVFNSDIVSFLHLGVFDTDGHFCHHPFGALSVRKLFSDEYIDKVYKIYRHKDL